MYENNERVFCVFVFVSHVKLLSVQGFGSNEKCLN